MQEILTARKVKSFFPKRREDSHKGENGTCLVVGGSADFAGAPALAAMASLAALRAGIDLCIVAAPENAGWIINSYSPDLIVKKLRGETFAKRHLPQLMQLCKKADVILVGPGLGRKKQTLGFAREFAKRALKPLVIDADALRACAGLKFKTPAVLTPHAKEFEVFTGMHIVGLPIAEKIRMVKGAARKHRCVVLLKGKTDIISDGKRVFLNRTGNARMTVGGTGDVLAGLCTGFIALGMEPLHAACAAAFVNGGIGDWLLGKMGYSFIASDFIMEIPSWTKKFVR